MDQKKKAALQLLPNLLGEHEQHGAFLPASVDKAVALIDGLIAESDREGRRYLRRFLGDKASSIPVALYNEHTPDDDIDSLLKPMVDGARWGLISDAGLPCIADPGSKLVMRARNLGIRIQPFVGPSSILLALMQSGLPGQKFFFHGYLPKERDARIKELQAIEKGSRADGRTDIFIETPYRNQHLLEDLLSTLHEATLLAVGWELTTPDQGMVSQPVRLWKKSPLPNLAKRNAIFLVHALKT
jgi:16S rRNA (cytidine1402-2'-O)-methyltransferase